MGDLAKVGACEFVDESEWNQSKKAVLAVWKDFDLTECSLNFL